MTAPRRKRIFVLASVAILAMLLLSAGLAQVNLLPGQRVPWGFRPQPTQTLEQAPTVPGSQVLYSGLRVLIGLSLFLLPAALIYLLVSPKARKRVIRDLMMALGIMVLFQVLGPRIAQFIRTNMGDAGLGSAMGDFDPSSLTPDFITNPPSWLVWASSLILATLLLAIPIGLVAFMRWRSRMGMGQLGELDELAAEAQAALDSLQSGADFRNTVLRCYARMGRVLSEKRGLDRAQAMTPREFEHRLADTGLPRQPIHDLTYLFEQVRYGAKTPGPGEEERALASLQAIVQAVEAAR